jgi:hypothetical protein
MRCEIWSWETRLFVLSRRVVWRGRFSRWNLNDFDWPTSRWRVLHDTLYPSPYGVPLFTIFLVKTPESERWRVFAWPQGTRPLNKLKNQGHHSTRLIWPNSLRAPQPAKKKTRNITSFSSWHGSSPKRRMSGGEEWVPFTFPALSIFKRDYSPKLCRLFENDCRNAKNPALWNHLEPPLRQMNQYKVN